MDLLAEHLSKIRVPTSNEKLYKDECVYSFDNPVNIFLGYFLRVLKLYL